MKGIGKSVFLFFLMIFCFVGCKGVQEDKNISKKSDDKTISFDENSDQFFFESDNIKKVTDGYYFFYDDKLYFCDDENMKVILLCTSPNCSHTDELCNAYFGTYGKQKEKGFFTNALFSTKDSLYTIGYEMSDVTDLYLYKVSRDGTEREKIGYLSSLDKGAFFCDYTMHEGYLYHPEINDKEVCLKRISLESGKITNILDLSDKYSVTIDTIRGYKDYVYFDATWYEDKELTKQNAKLYRYSIADKKIETVMDDFMCNSYQVVDEDTIIYMDLSYELKILNISARSEKVLRKTDGNFGVFSYDGKLVYYWRMQGGKVEIYDLSGNQLDNISLNGGECCFGDDKYLFAKNMASEDGEIDQSIMLAYLNKSQIGHGDLTWKYLKSD